MAKTKVLVIVPCYNEEGSLEQTITDLKEKYVDIVTGGYIVINDGSSDGTREICEKNQFPVINMPFNLGLSNAVQTGMRYAYMGGYDMAMQFDGDGQHLPEHIPEMIKCMLETSADIVIGSRYMQKTSSSLRTLGGWIIKIAVRLVTGKKLTDPTSGMRLYNSKMIERFANRINYDPEPDTLAYLINQGIKIVEIPVTMQERKAGKSYLSALNATSYMLRVFVSIIFVQWFRAKEGV